MSLRRRLVLAQVPLAAALLVVGAVSVRTVSSLGEGAERILKDNYRSLLAAQRMGDAIDGLDREALLRGLSQPSVEPSAALQERFESELRVQEGNLTEAGEAEATARLRAAWDAYRGATGAAPGAADLPGLVAGLQRRSLAVRGAIDEVLAINQDAMVRKSNEARRSAERLLQLMLAATAAALALGVLVSVVLTSRIVKPLSGLSLAVRRFGEGDLESRARVAGRDEIAALAAEFNTMADRLEQYRKSSLGDLIQAQQASQAAIDSLPDPVLVLDASGGVTNLNRAAEALLRLSPGVGAGAALHALEPVLRDRLEEVRAHVLSGKGAVVPRGFDEAIRVDLPDGPHRLLPRATALYSEEGAVTGVTVVLQDVTRLVRFDELKNDLVATVAHEFRTPLTSLRLAVHMCAEGAAGPLTAQQADLMAAARQDCERLQSIVDDILDLSRIQAGRIEIQAQAVDAAGLVRHAAREAEGAARAAGVALGLELPPEPLPVKADPERIGVVLANLLANAIRHTPPGGSVDVRAAAGAGGVRIEVQDAGEGIAPQYLDRIFDRFFQVPGSRRGGLGLGLYISREVVRAHGGDMGVSSEPGRGSTFWFTIPAAPQASPAA
ncbi:MAG TPA: ATP-binding protein [Anaeromyxobacteraceae bacterium]|nr:ATP-binding protein [Anaeromyxobacteraceae bacterium]